MLMHMRSGHDVVGKSQRSRQLVSEGIDGVPFSTGPNEPLEAIAVRYIHAIREQAGQILGDADILKHANRSVRRNFDQDVNVAAGLRLATCDRAKQRLVRDSATTEIRLMGTQRQGNRLSCSSYEGSKIRRI